MKAKGFPAQDIADITGLSPPVNGDQFCSAPSSADQKPPQVNNYQRFTITEASPFPEFLPALPGFF